MLNIKRYSNRKLYDTENRRYITLEDIGDFIRQGQEVQVLDYDSGEDITSFVLMQVITEEEKRFGASMPLQMLTQLIRASETRLENLRESVNAFLDPLEFTDEEIRRRLRELERKAVFSNDEVSQLSQILLDPDLRPVSKHEDTASANDLQPLQDQIAQLEKEIESLQQSLASSKD